MLDLPNSKPDRNGWTVVIEASNGCHTYAGSYDDDEIDLTGPICALMLDTPTQAMDVWNHLLDRDRGLWLDAKIKRWLCSCTAHRSASVFGGIILDECEDCIEKAKTDDHEHSARRDGTACSIPSGTPEGIGV